MKFTPSQLRELLDYDPDTGVLRWRFRSREHFPSDQAQKAWNGRCAGKEAGYPGREGYWQLTVKGITCDAHVVAWMIHHGRSPEICIDHRNGVRCENWIGNLREAADQAANQHNSQRHTDNRTGFKGVTRLTGYSRWFARIQVRGKTFCLGSYGSPEEAHAAYCAAAVKHHGEFARFA